MAQSKYSISKGSNGRIARSDQTKASLKFSRGNTKLQLHVWHMELLVTSSGLQHPNLQALLPAAHIAFLLAWLQIVLADLLSGCPLSGCKHLQHPGDLHCNLSFTFIASHNSFSWPSCWESKFATYYLSSATFLNPSTSLFDPIILAFCTTAHR